MNTGYTTLGLILIIVAIGLYVAPVIPLEIPILFSKETQTITFSLSSLNNLCSNPIAYSTAGQDCALVQFFSYAIYAIVGIGGILVFIGLLGSSLGNKVGVEVGKDDDFKLRHEIMEKSSNDEPGKYCNKCGQKLLKEDIFCGYCGTKL